MDYVLQTDPEAQPFKDSYEETYDTEKKKKRLEWQQAEYITLQDKDWFAKRVEAVNDPIIQETVKTLRKIAGEEAANRYFLKYLDNLAKVETRKGFYSIR